MAPIDRLIVFAPPDARVAADLVNSLRAEADKAGGDQASLLREAAGRIRSLGVAHPRAVRPRRPPA